MKNITQIKNSFDMKKIVLLFFLFILFNNSIFSQQVTGLSNWNIFLDPGHSQDENMGVYGYSEAAKNLGVALQLRQMLLDWTDIDTVYMSRTNSTDIVTLSQRTDLANTLGADHYHSIHGDASTNTSSNSTLIMWGQLGIGGPEKTPYGGKKMSQIMVGLLTAGMRTTTRGAMGDRDFYGVAGSTPYLWVNHYSTMASELSEAGFHTNPTQNQLNMNDKWKRLEAKTMFWTILKYHNLTIPFAGTVVGIIKDIESGLAVNGAIATLNGQSDTTDTWESLFHKYSSDPNLLRNGFYYFEDIPAGTHQLQVTAPGFDPYTVDVTTVDTFFTFKDVNLISNVPPKVVSTDPLQNDSLYPGIKNITINFSRPINKAMADSTIILTPDTTATFTWTNGDQTLIINTSNFIFDTLYQITIKGTLEDKYGHLFDGNGDGVGGDDYTYYVKTKVKDMLPPSIIDLYPAFSATNVELKPIISISFDEPLKTSTISATVKIIRNSTQTNAAYIARYYSINGKSVLNYFITTPLVENETYSIKVLAGLQDIYGNPTTSDFISEFTTGNSNYLSQTIIDNFDSGIASWLQPTASGSTFGVIPELTKATSVSSIFNLNTGSTKSMMFEYAYNENVTDSVWLIREYRSVASPSFDNSNLLQAFVFGDGNNNKFRFCVHETAYSTNYEVSPWFDIYWLGWKLVSWDLAQGITGNWIGNGTLEPPFVFDSFQFTYSPGNVSAGTYYLDDLRIATFTPTDIKQEDTQVPNHFALEQNYPNPFNPSTSIQYAIGSRQFVQLKIYDLLGNEVATLVDEYKEAGSYKFEFDVAQLSRAEIASGVYFYQLRAGNFIQTKKMILLK